MLLIIIAFTSVFLSKSESRLQLASCEHDDSTEIAQIIANFYSWHIAAIQPGAPDGITSPTFIRDSMGMTRLDFSTYLSSLDSLKFSSEFLESEQIRYHSCASKLISIPYDSFLMRLDLDFLETIGCDYDNRNRWFGGQEYFDSFRISKVTILSKIARAELELCTHQNDKIKNCKKHVWIDFANTNKCWEIIKFINR